MPKGYWVVHVNVTDTEKYDAYRELSGPAVEAYDGKFLVRGGKAEFVEGSAHPRTVVIEFESFDKALTAYHSPEYSKARERRAGGADFDLVIVEGA